MYKKTPPSTDARLPPMPLSELPRMKELLQRSLSSPTDARMRTEAAATAGRAKQRRKAATATHARVTARKKT